MSKIGVQDAKSRLSFSATQRIRGKSRSCKGVCCSIDQCVFAQSARTTRASFFVSNVFSTDIQTELPLPRGVQSFFLSRKELERTKPTDFQTRFPNNLGYFVVSHVGLNLSKSEALLYIDHFCSGLCGGGVYVLMHKVNGMWHVVDQHGTWVS